MFGTYILQKLSPLATVRDKTLGQTDLGRNHCKVLWMRKFRARAKQTEKCHLNSIWYKSVLVTQEDEPPVL